MLCASEERGEAKNFHNIMAFILVFPGTFEEEEIISPLLLKIGKTNTLQSVFVSTK